MKDPKLTPSEMGTSESAVGRVQKEAGPLHDLTKSFTHTNPRPETDPPAPRKKPCVCIWNAGSRLPPRKYVNGKCESCGGHLPQRAVLRDPPGVGPEHYLENLEMPKERP